jgi:hypothetical protein
MVEVRLAGLAQLHGFVVAITLGLVIDAATAPQACSDGFVQRAPIALWCAGGKQSITTVLTEANTPHQLFFWEAPAGTKDLRMKATLSSTGDNGRASLRVKCSSSDKVLVDSHNGFSRGNPKQASGVIDGVEWQWSHNPASHDRTPFEAWFTVKGSLPCDAEVSLINECSARLVGDIHVEWSSITPCSTVPLGCVPCADVQDACSHDGDVAVCDGSPRVHCITAASRTVPCELEIPGRPFILGNVNTAQCPPHSVHFTDLTTCVEAVQFLNISVENLPSDGIPAFSMGDTPSLTKYIRAREIQEGESALRHTVKPYGCFLDISDRGNLGPQVWLNHDHQRSGKHSGSTPICKVKCKTSATTTLAPTPIVKDLGRTADVLHPQAFAAATTTTGAAATTDVASQPVLTTSFLVPLSHELAGAFALQIQSSMDVESIEFKQLMITALAETIGVHANAFLRFHVASLGQPSQATSTRRLQGEKAVEDVNTVEAATNSKIVGVGYEVAAGSAERETEIANRLNNLDGVSSRARASLTDILDRHGVLVLAIQVTYQASPVAQLSLFTSPTTSSQGLVPTMPGLPIYSSPSRSPSVSEERENAAKPTMLPPAWLQKVKKAKPSWVTTTGALTCCLSIACCLSGIAGFCLCRLLNRCKTRAAESDKRSRSDRGKEASRLDLPRGKYEPVQSDDGHTGPPSVVPSIASDSSEAAGLRLLGNDGM